MCGVAGILMRDGSAVDRKRVVATLARLGHRGPDDSGLLGWDGTGTPRIGREAEVCTGARLALLHRRLAILDLSPAAWQPMSSADGRYHLVFNGEIYNYRELRQELASGGHSFVSSGDTEVLLAAWSRWGREALLRLVGMFALGVLDTRERMLLLARDFFGIKPLYYADPRRCFGFASEIRALLELTGTRPQVNPGRLYHYLRFGLTDHGGETMFAEVRQVPPAHLLSVDLDSTEPPRLERYWGIDLERRCELPPEAAAERLRELFLDSVRLHLRSDVPVGTALSGGVDSSSIVMAMRRLAGPSLELHTVSYLAGDPAIDESRWVDVVVASAEAISHRTLPSPGELAKDLETLIAVQEEPFGSTSIYAQHRVFRLAREVGLKVMLDGQGADELFGGYPRYVAARVASLLRCGRWTEAARTWRAAQRLPGLARRDLLLGLGQLVLPFAVQHMARQLAGRELGPRWLVRSWFAERAVALASPFPRSRRRDALREILHNALCEISLPMLLRYEDRNSMAFSIESRVPFLTPELATFALSLPESCIVADDATSKPLLRRAMHGIVPPAILNRRDKVGFATPERRWLGELRGWVEGTLGGDTARHLPFLDSTALGHEWQGVLGGRLPFDWRVWRWINTIRWIEAFDMDIGR